ncbi:MAG: retropepsin-like aspartic protease, partial [Agrobacterium sp.]|uniref:retropepsin-like aspartic protease n=1 Tax=Agrobacterium sp. TaxID=361 RepID=UPI0040379C88
MLTAAHADGESLHFAFAGHLNEHPVRVLCDTGATHSFVSASFVAAHAVPVHMLKHMQEWHAANNTVLSCSQFVKADLSLPGVTVPCKLNVMPSLLPDFDVLLGNDWLNEHEAVMSYQDKTLSLACDKGEPVVLPCPPADKSESGQSAVSNPASFLVNALRAKPPLASAKVAARWLR